jgi:26S proteasome regulatory subunit N10
MVLESTMVCVDNSDYMRNGDFVPTRLQAQQDAVNLVCHSKTRSNPENNVGLLTLANGTEVLATLTSDVGKLLSKLHQVRPKGNINFVSSIRIAHLVLKHRQGKNHRMRIIVFVGSPIVDDEKELVKLAKRLRKEKVNVDVVNFGEETINSDKLTKFVNAINGNEGTSSHLVTVPPGPLLSDALITSPVIVGEDGAGAVPGGFEFGIDPNEDPELALALRVSMEEQRARQEEEARKAVAASVTESGVGNKAVAETDEEMLLRQALEMSLHPTAADDDAMSGQSSSVRDYSMMSEDEQFAMAMQMSIAGSAAIPATGAGSKVTETRMETEDDAKRGEDEDLSEVMNDPEFLQSVLEGLPGVDPHSDAIRSAVGKLAAPGDAKKSDKKGGDGSKDDKK